MTISNSDLQKLCSNRGLIYLLSSDPPDYKSALKKLKYKSELKKLQIELIQMESWIIKNNVRLLIIFEGGEFAGKGATIRAFMEHLNPRSTRLVALPKPTTIEKEQWYFQRYIMQLPKPGELVFFDRSWYNRALVEPVNGFCTKKAYKQFMNEVNHFESMIHNDGMLLIKLYISIEKKIQAERIELIRENPLRRWELTKVDENAQKLWDKYKSYEKAMFEQTNTSHAPWAIIDGNEKYAAYLDAIKHVLATVPYKS